MNILIAENEELVQTYIQRILEKKGYTIFTALSVDEIIVIVNTYPIHLIVLDLILDASDGRQILYYMKENDLDIPIIVVSKKFDKEEATQLFELGIIDYLVKPINTELLLIKIDYLLKKF